MIMVHLDITTAPKEILEAALIPSVEIRRRRRHDAGFWAGWASCSDRVREFVRAHRVRMAEERLARLSAEDGLMSAQREILFLRQALREATIENDPFRELAEYEIGFETI